MPENKNKKKKVIVSSKKKTEEQTFSSVNGMFDILPKDEWFWKKAIETGFLIGELHDFYFMETPLLEPLSLFERGGGQYAGDGIKNIFSFSSRGIGKVAVRSEGRIPILRSYIEHHLGHFALPLKIFYIEQVAKYFNDGSQKMLQFHELGFEVVGDNDPVYDMEVVFAILHFFRILKIKNLSVKINVGGCKTCRGQYREKTKAFFSGKKKELCKKCAISFEKDVFCPFFCSDEKCVGLRETAPIILDYLCQNCNNHFQSILELMEDGGVLYELDPHSIRGREGYDRTIFRIENGDGLLLASGGRYDYLSETIAGRQIPAVGGSIILEHVFEEIKVCNIDIGGRRERRVFFIAVGAQAKKVGIRLMNELRVAGISVGESLGKKSFKGQMKAAEKSRVHTIAIIGQKEAYEETVIVRNTETGAQEIVTFEKLAEEIKKKLK